METKGQEVNQLPMYKNECNFEGYNAAILMILKSLKKEHYTAQPNSSTYATCIVLTTVRFSGEQ